MEKPCPSWLDYPDALKVLELPPSLNELPNTDHKWRASLKNLKRWYEYPQLFTTLDVQLVDKDTEVRRFEYRH